MGKEGSSSLTCCCPPHLLLPSFPITHLPASLYLWDHGERRNASGGGRWKERVPRHTDPARQHDWGRRGAGAGKVKGGQQQDHLPEPQPLEMAADGAAHLAEGVRKSLSLATLILRGNKFGDCGVWGLGKELAVSSSLTSLRRALQMAKRERDATLRDKDAEIARMRRQAYGVVGMDVETGVTHIVWRMWGRGRGRHRIRAFGTRVVEGARAMDAPCIGAAVGQGGRLRPHALCHGLRSGPSVHICRQRQSVPSSP
jgi:hypothetical protein